LGFCGGVCDKKKGGNNELLPVQKLNRFFSSQNRCAVLTTSRKCCAFTLGPSLALRMTGLIEKNGVLCYNKDTNKQNNICKK